MKLKKYKITYYLLPDLSNIEIIVFAISYEDACEYAKQYRGESFSCEEFEGREI